MKALLNKSELILQLQQLICDIDNLCLQYDAGNNNVIDLISGKLLTIFHNSEQSKSLLAQLKLVKVPMLCSSDTYNSKNIINFIGLLELEHSKEKGWSYTAKLNKSVLARVSQDNWWQNKKVIVDSDGIPFTRSKIVKSVANSTLLNLNTSGWKLKDADGIKSTINPIPETVRQIAFELLESFKEIDLAIESKLHHKF